MTNLRDDLREMRRENREDFQRLHARLDTFEARLASLEATRSQGKGWIQGAWFAAGGLFSALGWVASRVWPALLVFLAGSCTEALPPPAGAQGQWYEQDRPALVVLDVSPACVPAANAGVDYWRARSTVIRDVVQAGRTGEPGLGEILVVERPAEAAEGFEGRGWAYYFDEGRLTRGVAEVYTPECEILDFAGAALLFAHEIGHALGLGDTNNRGTLMFFSSDGRGDVLTPEEAAWVL